MDNLKLFLRMLMRFFAALPLPVALGIGRFFGFLYGSVIRYRRRYVLQTLQICFPEKTAAERVQIANNMYRNLGMNTVEIARLSGGATADLDARVSVEGEEYVRQALAQGKGALILTAHLGNWDLLGMYTAKRGYALTIISKEIKNEALNDMWMRLRSEFGVKIVLSHNSYRACLKVLKQNELIGFILDTNRPKDAGIFVDYFGRPACTTPGLAFMSAQAGAPVIPVFIHREGKDRHVIRALPALPPPPDREEATILKATQEYTRIIEEEVRRYPDQWLWVHKRWKNQPVADQAK
jgi:KDO2-lipid IV(A) lauroyltransferase